MGRDSEPVGARYPCRYGPSRAYLCLACALIIGPSAVYAIVVDSPDWLGTLVALAVTGACAAFVVLVGLAEALKRRLLCAIGRIAYLAASLPRGTDEETLAVLGEIRARYAEALWLAEKFGGNGEQLAAHMRDRLDRVDQAYDAEAGRLRRADAGVGDVAADVRGFSAIDDVPLRPWLLKVT